MPAELTLLHACAPASYGGLERVVGAVTAGLSRRGHRVAIAAVLDPGATVPSAISAAAGHGVEVLPLRPQRRSYLAERRALRRVAAELGADVLHTHGYRADVVAGPVATRLGLARVATAHGFTGGGWKNRAYECLQRRALRRCDAVIAVSDELARALAEAGIGGVHTVPNGPPLAAEPLPPRSAREALGAGPDEYHIGWVGRLSPEKGPDVLLRALEALRDEPSWSASFVGDGAMRDDLERAAEGSGLGDRVRFAGRVEDAARLFSGFDLFVLSSRSEGTPVALLEAVAARTPVVASRVGGVERVVGPAGAVLIPPGDPRALADAILSARADPSAATRRAEAALHARDARPDWIAAYEAIYREVLSGAAAAPEADR